MMLYDVLKASKGLYVDDEYAMLWGKQLGGWTVSTITGTLPITFRSNGTALINYRIYGTADGAGVQTENLFDKNSVTPNYFKTGNGIVSTTRGAYSDYMPVQPNTSYYITKGVELNSFYTACAYDMTKTFISYCNLDNTDGAITTPSNCAYVIINAFKTNLDAVMFTAGSIPPETYIPYGYKLPLTVTSETENKDTDIYIGDSKLLSGDYVDYESGKIVRNGTQQDPPLPFSAIETFKGENTLSSTETLGEVTIKGKIKEA